TLKGSISTETTCYSVARRSACMPNGSVKNAHVSTSICPCMKTGKHGVATCTKLTHTPNNRDLPQRSWLPQQTSSHSIQAPLSTITYWMPPVSYTTSLNPMKPKV